MASETILRPDAKGRIGLGSLAKQLQERFVGRPISGYAATITPDGTILLRPRIEVDAEHVATLVLDAADRDAFLAALEVPPAPSETLRHAARRHRRSVASR